MKILQINTTINSGSTGRIAEEIGNLVIRQGWQSYIAFGRNEQQSTSVKIKIGNQADQFLHLLETRLFDRHGLGSRRVTERLVEQIALIDPDIVHLHNLHGYYINYEVLFRYLNFYGKKVIWTLHDCWAFTGHCAHFERIGCYKWKNICYDCPSIKNYPSSWLMDRSSKNYILKKELFSGLAENCIITVPSAWLHNYVRQSFLKEIRSMIIYNGVNMEVFKPCTVPDLSKYGLNRQFIVLGVASIFTTLKGINDFMSLSSVLPQNYSIVLIGMIEAEVKKRLGSKILHISRTEDVFELAAWYSAAAVFVNPTYSDNFPTTNIEALACGTPVVTYDTGGSPEAVSTDTGSVVRKGDMEGLIEAVKHWAGQKEKVAAKCRERAMVHFNKDIQWKKYLNLYEKVSVQ